MQDAQHTLRLESERLKRWRDEYAESFPQHRLSFNKWVLSMVEQGIKEAK